MSLGVPRGVKKTGRSLHYKNKNFGVERCELHVWKGLSEWNNFKKACNGLKSILFMLYIGKRDRNICILRYFRLDITAVIHT